MTNKAPPLSFKQKLAWQAVGFVIGAVLFVMVGGLSGCATAAPASPGCAHAHAEWMSRAQSLLLCKELVGCQINAEDIRRERVAHAHTIAACDLGEKKK